MEKNRENRENNNLSLSRNVCYVESPPWNIVFFPLDLDWVIVPLFSHSPNLPG